MYTPYIWHAMVKGTVAFFNEDGGYGFIEVEDNEEHDLDDDEDVYFHMQDVVGPDLEEGEVVEFEIEEADKGPRATDLERQD
jgi:CspA family cold shock protein